MSWTQKFYVRSGISPELYNDLFWNILEKRNTCYYSFGLDDVVDKTPKWIENPEWKKKQIEKKINHNNSIIGIYEENIVRCKNEIKELEKELNGK